MNFLGNCLWLLLGGFFVGLGYLLGAIVLFPLFPFLWPLVKHSFWPFGRSPVSRSDLANYKKNENIEGTNLSLKTTSFFIRFLANVVWILLFGWWLAIFHLICAVINAVFFWMIITIPFITAHMKLIPVSLRPFGIVIVPNSLRDEIQKGSAKQKLGI